MSDKSVLINEQISSSRWKLVPVEPTEEMLNAACQDGVSVNGKPVWKHDVHFVAKWKYGQMLAAAPDAPRAEPVDFQYQSEDGKWRGFISPSHYENTKKSGDYPIRALYAFPPDADANAEIARLRVKTLEQAQDIRDLLGLKDDNTKLRAEVERLAQKNAEIEASLEIEKGQCELREEENRILFARTQAQSAALTKAREAMERLGAHDQNCGVFDLDDDDDRHKPCTCGFIETLAAIDALGQVSEEVIEQKEYRKEPK